MANLRLSNKPTQYDDNRTLSQKPIADNRTSRAVQAT